AAWLQLDGVNAGTDRNICQRQTVAGLNRSVFAAANSTSDSDALACQDVMVSSVSLLDAGDAGAAARIVLNVLNRGFSTRSQIEINNSDKPADAAAFVTGSDPALVVAAAGLLADNCQALKRLLGGDAVKILRGHAATAGSCRFVSFNSHYLFLFSAFLAAFSSAALALASSAASSTNRGSESPSLSVT